MFKQIRSGMLVSSLLYLVAGCFLVAWPDDTIRLCCYAVGGLLVLCGGVQIGRFVRGRAEHFVLAYLNLLWGILSLAAGLFLLVKPEVAVSIFPVLFGIFVLFDSVARLSSAIDLKRAGYERWWSYLLLSLLSIGFGLLILYNPFATVSAMVTAIGVVLILEAVINVFGLSFAGITVGRLNRAAEKLALAAEKAAEEAEAAAADEDEAARKVAAHDAAHDADGPIIDVDSTPVE